MPKGTFDDTLKSAPEVEPFAYLEVKNQGQLARLFIPRDEGTWEWVHTLRAPILDINNLPVIEVKKRKDNTTYTAFVDDFVAQRICLGDPDVLKERGLDPDHCPMCKAAADGLKGAMPERRFALVVVRYATQGEGQLRNPPSADVLIWKLSQKMYNALQGQRADIRELREMEQDAPCEWNMADIVIECTSPEFHRTEFRAPKRSGYHTHAPIKAYIDALLADPANLPTDDQLRLACARPGVYAYMKADAEKAMKRWARADRLGLDPSKWPEVSDTALSGGEDAADLDDRLDSLMDNAPADDGHGGDDPMTEFMDSGQKAAAVAKHQEAPGPAGPVAESRVPAAVGAPAKAQSFGDIWPDED